MLRGSSCGQKACAARPFEKRPAVTWLRTRGAARSRAQALHIFLEFVPGGSIASLLSKFGPFAERVISVYTRQILEGLEYLHRNQIMHRDIKGANILVDNAGVVKLADFGASRQLADLVTMESGFKSMKGTPYWMAPEVIKQTGHGRQADIWSVGCTAVEMATAKPPWSEYVTQVSALFHIASAKGPPPLPAGLSPEALDFMLLCFNRVPKDRPNATRLLQHPFVAPVVAPDAERRGGAAAPPPVTTPIRRTVSTIPEGPSPGSEPSTGPGTGGAHLPSGGLVRYTPAGDAFSSLGSEAASSPGESDDAAALDTLRRRLALDAHTAAAAPAAAATPTAAAGGLPVATTPLVPAAAPPIGTPGADTPASSSMDSLQPAPGGVSPDVPPLSASPALSGRSLDSGGAYNPMEEPSWTPEQALLLSPAALASGSTPPTSLTPPPTMAHLPPPSPAVLPRAEVTPASAYVGGRSAPRPARAQASATPQAVTSTPPLPPPPPLPRPSPRRTALSTSKEDSPVARAIAALEKRSDDGMVPMPAPLRSRSPALGDTTPQRASLRYATPTAGAPGVPSLVDDSPTPPPPAAPLPRPFELDDDESLISAAPRISTSRVGPDETIDSLLARAEQQSVAAREEARREQRRNKQAQWEQELQRELEAQRAEQRSKAAASLA